MPVGEMLRWVHPAVILVATDLSDLDRLMPLALRDAGEARARLILLHVMHGGVSLSADARGMPFYDPAEVREFAGRTLQPWCALARARNIACDIVVREGDAAQQISASARHFQADRIYLGTRSRGRVTKILLGSVAEQVLRSVHSPVITVGPEANLPVDRKGEQKVVLHATSLGETSRPGAALACQIAAAQNARLALLHVLPAGYERRDDRMRVAADDTVVSQLQSLADQISRALPAGRVSVEPYVAYGNPSIEILAFSTELRAEMIVLSAPYRSFLHSFTCDGTIYRVLAHARCPVLTLREPAADENGFEIESLASGLRG